LRAHASATVSGTRDISSRAQKTGLGQNYVTFDDDEITALDQPLSSKSERAYRGLDVCQTAACRRWTCAVCARREE
jgi:hypothetical protein